MTATAEDRSALADTVRAVLADQAGEAEVRRAMASPQGYDPALWQRLAALGVVGLLVDPAHGGAGLGAAELEIVMEEAGAALLCAPLLSSGVLAAGLLQAIGDETANARLLPGIADGSRIATVALTGPHCAWTRADVAVTARDADGWRLDGFAGYVTDAAAADTMLVVAEASGGVAVFEVAAGAPGLSVAPLPTFDRTRRLAHLTFAGTPARRLGGADDAWPAVERMLDLARVALAGEQAGGARRVLDMTVGYARERHQFGRAIGSFQAIKHMAADLLLESESATSAARHAAARLAAGAPDAARAISLAAFACSDAFVRVAADAIQMHGGIAFTWEHPAHLYLRRARADAQLFGTPAFYRERFVQALERAA